MRRSLVFATVAMLAITAPSFAAQNMREPSWAAGQLERFDPQTRALVIKQGTHERTFSVTGNARFMENGKRVQAAALTADVGHEVRVRYTSNAIGQYADRVDLMASATSSATSSGATRPRTQQKPGAAPRSPGR